MNSVLESEKISKTVLQGVIYKKLLGHYTVYENGRFVTCSISSKLRRILLYPTADPNSIRPHVIGVKDIDTIDPVAIGDDVRFVEAMDGTGMILEIMPRRSKLVRRSAVPMPSANPFEQVIVANPDQVVAVISVANPAPKWNLLDRYLVSAESSGLNALICITKYDLLDNDKEIEAEINLYRSIGYPIVLTSVVTGDGIEDLRVALKNRTSVLVGKSGVGKSSLLNSIQPGLGIRVHEVNVKTGKGRHTTTHLEMFPLEFGGNVIDTPGMREYGLWEIDETDLALLFPEMRPYVGKCRFGLDCSHTHEPGCALLKAVGSGEVSHRRYETMLRLRE